jgi:hypothetical protein
MEEGVEKTKQHYLFVIRIPPFRPLGEGKPADFLSIDRAV